MRYIYLPVYLLIILSLCISISLYYLPDVDIKCSIYFYNPIYQDNILIKLIFRLIPYITIIITIISLMVVVYKYISTKCFKKTFHSSFFYLLVTLAIGPGIIVNSILKEHFGRARPKHVQELGGDKKFTRPFVISDQCQRNCSFASGHAAAGYYLTAIAYIIPLCYFRRIFLSGFIFGSIVGLVRIIQGGHFLSDVTFACFVVLTVNHIVFLLWSRYTNK